MSSMSPMQTVSVLCLSSGSSGRIEGGGARKHEIYAATFGSHLLYGLFLQGRGAWTPWLLGSSTVSSLLHFWCLTIVNYKVKLPVIDNCWCSSDDSIHGLSAVILVGDFNLILSLQKSGLFRPPLTATLNYCCSN